MCLSNPYMTYDEWSFYFILADRDKLYPYINCKCAFNVKRSPEYFFLSHLDATSKIFQKDDITLFRE